jgi:hypothetical protein
MGHRARVAKGLRLFTLSTLLGGLALLTATPAWAGGGGFFGAQVSVGGHHGGHGSGSRHGTRVRVGDRHRGHRHRDHGFGYVKRHDRGLHLGHYKRHHRHRHGKHYGYRSGIRYGRGYGVRYGHRQHAVGHYCSVCHYYYPSIQLFYNHVHYQHGVAMVDIPHVIVQADFGWVFHD